jgi:hypothetical protein
MNSTELMEIYAEAPKIVAWALDRNLARFSLRRSLMMPKVPHRWRLQASRGQKLQWDNWSKKEWLLRKSLRSRFGGLPVALASHYVCEQAPPAFTPALAALKPMDAKSLLREVRDATGGACVDPYPWWRI